MNAAIQTGNMMTTLETGLVGLLILIAMTLVVLVLLQRGKGADIGAAFGSGASNTVFGSAGATSFLTKVTAWLAVTFFLVSFSLAYTARERAEAVGQVGIPQTEVLSEDVADDSDDTSDEDEAYPEIPDFVEEEQDAQGEFEEIPEVPDM